MDASRFRFLHAADLHLDSPLRGLSSYEGAPVEALRGATRAAFERLVELGLEREVAFVVLSGDLFDGDWPDANSWLWFAHQLGRWTQAGIRVFLVHGNHDAESVLASRLPLPEGVHAFGTEPATVVLDELDVALHGWSYEVPHESADPVPRYPAPLAGRFNLGLLHTGLEGYEGHGHYAPCTLRELADKGYDYWALGHVHRHQVVSTAPWIVYPGNLQGRHARELGPKGAVCVEVADGGVEALEFVPCDVARWAQADVDASGLEQREDLLLRTQGALEVAWSSAEGRPAAVRVCIAGATALDDELRATRPHLVNEVRALAGRVANGLWVETVRLETEPTAAAETEGGLAALAGRLRGASLEEDDLRGLAEALARFGERLPEAVRDVLAPTDPSALARRIDPARRFLAARVTGAGEPSREAPAAPAAAEETEEAEESP